MTNTFKISILSLSLILFSCGGEEPVQDQDNSTKNESDTLLTDTLIISNDEAFEGEVYTACAAIDGPDEFLWVHQAGEWDGEVKDPLPEFEMLHVIPYKDWGEGLILEMGNILYDNFQIYGELGEKDVPVVFWFDRSKTAKAVEYSLKNGKADGIVTMYYPDGRVYLQRKYKEGRWLESYFAPASADWRFVQNASKLWIEDIASVEKNQDGERVYKLWPSVQEKGPGDNSLYKILEKESYQKPFQINDEVFTGVLQGFYESGSPEIERKQFELHFNDGWLDGNVFIYNDWGELVLHEIFEMGELDSTVFEIEYSDMDGMAKPIIYIYPEEETEVSVRLNLDGHLTHTYPKYNRGWNVTAKPDGELIDDKGQTYYALYWEGENHKDFVVKDGFVVPGNETATFLEEALRILGLNRREANEFIVFWLPILEDNPYNLIHFSSEQYAEIAELKIQPEPETLIRVMMVYQPLQAPIDIPLQNLNTLKKERKGFTVVEWGGSLLEEPVVL